MNVFVCHVDWRDVKISDFLSHFNKKLTKKLKNY